MRLATTVTVLMLALIAAGGCSNASQCKEARTKAAAALKECLAGMGCNPGMSEDEKAALVAAYQKEGKLSGMMTMPDDPAYQRFAAAYNDAQKVCAGN